MGQTAVVIPEKIYFKIGEVCDLVGVQAHVLRYWETEFPMLSPQKNRSGQRSYRRRDVEISLRIKELLYDEMFTIAGAKKKLHNEMREPTKLRVVSNDAASSEAASAAAPTLFDSEIEIDERELRSGMHSTQLSDDGREALRSLASQLLELREMLKTSQTEEASVHLRNN
ncbi:MAG: MerR family transcriptional regulator [Pyrinomonadaceae bacterium]